MGRPNPLMQYMRQPKIYIRLPSQGKYWANGALEMTETEDLPVYAMTAKDELTFKTPDALLNGQGVVDVIQSCVPNIKNAWECPNIDLDAILIAIRIATYGNKMEVSHTVPNTTETVTHDVDLSQLLDQIFTNAQWIEQVEINDTLTCYLRPLTYRHVTKTSLKAFEAQKIMQVVNNDSYSEEQKIDSFGKSFNTMTQITVDLITDSIFAIKTPDDSVDEPAFIHEFISNADSVVFNKIQDHINKMRDLNSLKPLIVTATPEQIELGAPETYEMPVGFDNANFFGNGS